MWQPIIVILLFVTIIQSVSIFDEIYLEEFDESFFIKDEVYKFHLVPSKRVPKNIIAHTIFTASKKATQEVTKRYLNIYKRSLDVLPVEDYQILERYLDFDVPHLKFDAQKRSLAPTTSNGRRIIRLSEKVRVTFNVDESEKRQIGDVPLGTQFCLHIPFVTQCDNSPSFDAVKATLEAHIAESNAEIDNIRAVSNARWKDLEATLNEQNQLFDQLANNQADQLAQARDLANILTYQGLDMAHADNVISARIKHLQYMTQSIVNYANALQSTDPRAVVAQPALIELFDSYLTALDIAVEENFIPIVSKTKFNFTEILLPEKAFRNTESVNASFMDTQSLYRGVTMTIGGTTKRFIGTFTPIHPVIRFVDPDYVSLTTFFGTTDAFNSQLRCFSLFGYNVLTDADLAFFGQIDNGPKVEQDLSACDIHRLKEGDQTLYQYLTYFDSRYVPFYSNCQKGDLPQSSGTVNYINAYPDLSTGGTAVQINSVDVNERHFVTSNCYINLNPAFVGMTYADSSNRGRVIENIPYGYRTNQFTINPAGELSSSIKFVKTSEWVQVYKAIRVSENNVIVSEIDDISNDNVLFHSEGNTIIDASDSFLGGNNGRDCIVEKDVYDESIVDCFFQNNRNSVPADPYLRGETVTTGVARHNRKFDFDIQYIDSDKPEDGYEVTLKPKADADFNFYVQLDSTICPTLDIGRNIDTGCFISLFYSGSETIRMGTTTLVFTNSVSTPVINYGTNTTITAGTKNCFFLTCSNTFNINRVLIRTPSFSVIPDDISNLINDETFTANVTAQIEKLDELQQELAELEATLRDLAEKFGNINFNISDEITYKNFTDLRDRVQDLLNQIDEYNAIASNSRTCGEGIFGSIMCFLEDMLGTLIVLAIIAGVLVGTYFLIRLCII